MYLRLIIETLFLCISAHLTVLLLSNPVLNLIFLLLPITSIVTHTPAPQLRPSTLALHVYIYFIEIDIYTDTRLRHNTFDTVCAVLSAPPMFQDGNKSPEVVYITMALIGLLVICVFVIAGLVLIVAKRRREGRAYFYILATVSVCLHSLKQIIHSVTGF